MSQYEPLLDWSAVEYWTSFPIPLIHLSRFGVLNNFGVNFQIRDVTGDLVSYILLGYCTLMLAKFAKSELVFHNISLLLLLKIVEKVPIYITLYLDYSYFNKSIAHISRLRNFLSQVIGSRHFRQRDVFCRKKLGVPFSTTHISVFLKL